MTMTAESTPDDKHAVVLPFGGTDSATTAYEATRRSYGPYVFHTSYDQKIEPKRYDCVHELTGELDARGSLHIETSHLKRIGASSLIDDSMTVADADVDADDIPISYVPFHNVSLPSMVVPYVEANDCNVVFVGAYSEDYSGYPGCRSEFFGAFEAMAGVGTKPGTAASLEVPFAHDSKISIVRRGLEFDVPFEYTWSCHRVEEPVYGTCDSCTSRLQTFQNLGERDPIPYTERPGYADGDADPDAAWAA